jgi:hypothetical protein
VRGWRCARRSTGGVGLVTRRLTRDATPKPSPTLPRALARPHRNLRRAAAAARECTRVRRVGGRHPGKRATPRGSPAMQAARQRSCWRCRRRRHTPC